MIWAVVEAFGLFNRGYNFVTIMELKYGIRVILLRY
jgi:hypothetical protein